MTDLPNLPLADDIVGQAVHGSYCPKMCSHTCPVLRATGLPESVPWSFHRTVADLAAGTLAPQDAAPRLRACSGCGACAEGCEVDGQDVPAQVRAGRAALLAVDAADVAVTDAVAAVTAGDSPFTRDETPYSVAAASPTVTLVAGCRDDAATVAAASRLLSAGGEVVRVVVPEGCCGGVLRDLGANAAADDARAAVGRAVDGSDRLVVLDPHCRDEVGAAAGDVEVEDLVTLVARLMASGDLFLTGLPESVRWHEPCLFSGTSAAGAGPAALAHADTLVELPGEAHHGCSGGGMGMDLLAPDIADQVAHNRRAELRGPGPLVTGCSGAVERFRAAGEPAIDHIVTLLASLLDDDPESVA